MKEVLFSKRYLYHFSLSFLDPSTIPSVTQKVKFMRKISLFSSEKYF